MTLTHSDKSGVDPSKPNKFAKDLIGYNLGEGTELYLIKQFYPQTEAN